MQPTIYGMAVLMLRIAVVCMSFILCRGIDWHRAVSRMYAKQAVGLYVFVSIAIGHLVGSFLITVMEAMREIALSAFS